MIKRLILALFLIVLSAQIALAETATLSWDANTESDLAGYKVYYGIAPGVYGVPVDVGNVTTHVITGLEAGITYYFAATAYDDSGNESGFSSEVSKSFTGPILTASLAGTVIDFSANTTPAYYKIEWGDTPGNGYFGEQVLQNTATTFDFASTGLAPKTYLVVVRGFDSADVKILESEVFSIVIEDKTAPTPPTGLTVAELLAQVIEQNKTMIALLQTLVDR